MRVSCWPSPEPGLRAREAHCCGNIYDNVMFKLINLHLVEEAILAYVPIHLWDVVGQVRQGMELNETFFVVFLGPGLMGMGDGGTPAAALGLLHFLEAEALLVLLLLLLLLCFRGPRARPPG